MKNCCSFYLLGCGIEFPVAICIVINKQVRRLRDNHFVVEHRDAEWRFEIRVLNKDAALVRASAACGVFEHNDTITFRAASFLSTVVYALGHIKPALRVEVHVRRVEKQGRCRPQRDFKSLGHGEQIRRHERRAGAYSARRLAVGLLLLWHLREHAERHICIARLAFANHTAVINRDLRREALNIRR